MYALAAELQQRQQQGPVQVLEVRQVLFVLCLTNLPPPLIITPPLIKVIISRGFIIRGWGDYISDES